MSVDPAQLEARIRHLEMLQAVINRMAASSANLKTWCVAIVSAIIAFAATIKIPEVMLYTAPLILIIAGLDAQYLRLERAFRSQFDSVRHSSIEKPTDFLISPSWSAGTGLISVLFSWSVWLFYLPILLLFLGLSRLL